MALHIGEIIRKELYKQQIPISVFAKKIQRSRNNVYELFKHQSIDLELLSKISEVLKVDFLALYEQQKQKPSKGTVAETDKNYRQHLLEVLEQKLKLMELEFQVLKKELALLKTVHK